MNNSVFDIKLIVSDLDGTFLNDCKRISVENAGAAHMLAEQGILFTFCTGRPVGMFAAYAAQIGITLPVIGCNGGVVYDRLTRKVIASNSFSKRTLMLLGKYALENNFDFQAYTLETVYYSRNSKRVGMFYEYNRQAKAMGHEEGDITKLTDTAVFFEEKVTKILIAELHSGDLAKMRRFLQNFTDIEYVSSMPNVLDICPEGVTKGTGTALLAAHLGIDMKNVCAFGDAANDVSMMQAAGCSVCMANGTEEAKAAAVYTTVKTNNENGFAEAVERFVLKNACRKSQ